MFSGTSICEMPLRNCATLHVDDLNVSSNSLSIDLIASCFCTTKRSNKESKKGVRVERNQRRKKPRDSKKKVSECLLQNQKKKKKKKKKRKEKERGVGESTYPLLLTLAFTPVFGLELVVLEQLPSALLCQALFLAFLFHRVCRQCLVSIQPVKCVRVSLFVCVRA